MKLKLVIDENDKLNLISFVEATANRKFVIQRKSRNVDGGLPGRSRADVWFTMAACLFSTQQRSGPNSRINQFMLKKPFPLSLDICSKESDLEELIQQEIQSFRGIRFAPKIAKQLKTTFDELESGEWLTIERFGNELAAQRTQAPMPEHFELERRAASYMRTQFSGFGPKQSRNFWQSLGLSRYEFVLDSRVLKWLREMGFPLPLSSMALGEEEYYCFISDILRKWCIETNILPCVLDAAIFSSFDTEEWSEETSIW